MSVPASAGARSAAPARIAWGLVAALAVAGLCMSFSLTVTDALSGVSGQPLGRALTRLLSYFTILTNLLVAIAAVPLMTGRALGPLLRALLLNAVAGIIITGVVHWFLLRPTADPQGLHVVTDLIQHIAIPWLAPLAWAATGPFGVLRLRDIAAAVVFPLAFTGWTLLHGAITAWYPYGFIDVGLVGYRQALTMAAMILGVMMLLSVLMWARDAMVRRMRSRRGRGASDPAGPPRPERAERTGNGADAGHALAAPSRSA